MGAMKAYQMNLNEQADKRLGLIRGDLLLVGGWAQSPVIGPPGEAEESPMHEAIAANLRVLAYLIEAGATPDPFPVFRHGEEKPTAPRDIVDALDMMVELYGADSRADPEFLGRARTILEKYK